MTKNEISKNISILLFFILFCNSSVLLISLGAVNNKTESSAQKQESLKSSVSDNLNLLHFYDFEDDIVGQDPTGITLSVNDPIDSGSVNVDNLGDEQQNHVALHKSGGSKSIRLTDNVSYYGDIFDSGELHFKFYHDNSLFGIHFRDSTLPGLNGLLFAIDFWDGNVGRHGVTTYTTYTLNQWTNLIIYYDIALGWMFELDGVIFGDGYSFSFERENPSGIEFIQWRSAYSGGGNGFLRIDDIYFYYYKVSVLWRYPTGSNEGVYSSPALGDVDGDGELEVVVGSHDHNVYALNGEDGSLVWNYTTGARVFSSPVLGDVDGDGELEVVVGSFDHNVYALNGEDGSLVWNYTTGAQIYSSPALGDVDGDGELEVVVGSWDHNVYVLNGEDGSLAWNYTTGKRVYSSPALGDVDGDGELEVVVGSHDHNVYALNGEDGSLVWNFTTGAWVYSLVLGDVDWDEKLEVVVGSYDHNVYALNGEDGSELWSYDTGAPVFSSPALGDVDGDGELEVVVGNVDDGKVFVLNGEDGSYVWSYITKTWVMSSPALGDVDGDGKLEVVVGSYDFNVYALNGEDGSCAWSYTTGLYVASSPVLGDMDGDGRLEVVVGSCDKNVYALKPIPSGEITKWQGLAGEDFYRTKALSLDLRPDFTTSQQDIHLNTDITNLNNVYIRADITNLRVSYDGNIIVRFYDEFEGSSTQIGADQIITSLSREETKTVYVEWFPVLFHNITIIIDPDNSIKEVHEDNNIAVYYYKDSISKPPIVDDNNGIMNLKLIGDGVISGGGTDPNSLIEQFDDVIHVPNYDYNADINIIPQYYAKDTLISGPLTGNIPLDWVNNQYISNIEPFISSAEYYTKRGTHIKHALNWNAVGNCHGYYDRAYYYEHPEIPKFQDNDYSTSGSGEFYSVTTCQEAGCWTYAQTAVEIGTEILEREWDWNWELESIELWWTQSASMEIHSWFPINDYYGFTEGMQGQYKIDIMAKTASGSTYGIPIIDYLCDGDLSVYYGEVTNIPGFYEEPCNEDYPPIFSYHTYLNLNDLNINLEDVKRYSDTHQWYANHGNPVITIRFLTSAGTDWLWDNARSLLDIRECSVKYRFKSDVNDEKKLSDPSDLYFHFKGENVLSNETLGWANRVPINSINSYLRLGNDLYNTYEYIIINVDYIKFQYYKISPITKCQLKINDNPINRQFSSWIYKNAFDDSSLYNALGSFASVNLSALSLTYEPWDSGWEYTDSIVFAYQIDLAIVLEDNIPYYDTHGEYLYDLGFWQRDIPIEWKEVQLEGVYIEELYINDLLQNPWRIFLDYHKENIELWKTSQQISYTWPEGSSYEVITLEFNTIEYNTLYGSDIEVLDENTGVNITFSEVTSFGMTTIEKSEEEPDPPSGFEVVGDYYDITTDASYSGLISLAIPYNESKVIGPEENLKIWHWEPSTGWTDGTTGVDTIDNIIYGEFTTFSTFIVLEKVEHEYILAEIDQLIEKIDNCLDTCWRKSSNKNAMINKLIELKNLVSADELGEAYDKLLHDIKPKLTGLKTDENEEAWGNGVFENPWVTCEDLQEEYCLDCNVMLDHLSVLFLSSPLETSIVYDSNQIIYIGCSLIGLLGIIFFNQTWRKKKLI